MAFSVDVNNQSCLCEKFLIKRRLDHFLAGTCTGARGRARTLLSDRPVPVSQLFLIDEVVVHVLRVVDSKIGPTSGMPQASSWWRRKKGHTSGALRSRNSVSMAAGREACLDDGWWTQLRAKSGQVRTVPGPPDADRQTG